MDGNGRWATSRGKSRSEGHREGAQAIDRLMDASLELGLKIFPFMLFLPRIGNVLSPKSVLSLAF